MSVLLRGHGIEAGLRGGVGRKEQLEVKISHRNRLSCPDLGRGREKAELAGLQSDANRQERMPGREVVRVARTGHDRIGFEPRDNMIARSSSLVPANDAHPAPATPG